MAGILQDIVNSIFEPGVNRGVLLIMNASFLGLFLILLYLLYATSFNIHVCLLFLLSLLLFISIQWFIKQTASLKLKKN